MAVNESSLRAMIRKENGISSEHQSHKIAKDHS